VAGSFVGELEGTSALIGLVTDGDRVRAYACDGKDIARWFTGSVKNGELDLREGGLRLQATLTADGATGTLTLADSSSRTFRLEAVRGDAGLYQGEATHEGVRYLGRWVVAEGGAQTGKLSTSEGATTVNGVLSRTSAATIPVYNDLAAPALDLRGARSVATLTASGGKTFQLDATQLSADGLAGPIIMN
jgi:hypothetical protein